MRTGRRGRPTATSWRGTDADTGEGAGVAVSVAGIEIGECRVSTQVAKTPIQPNIRPKAMISKAARLITPRMKTVAPNTRIPAIAPVARVRRAGRPRNNHGVRMSSAANDRVIPVAARSCRNCCWFTGMNPTIAMWKPTHATRIAKTRGARTLRRRSWRRALIRTRRTRNENATIRVPVAMSVPLNM